jgi:hypothetical protein
MGSKLKTESVASSKSIYLQKELKMESTAIGTKDLAAQLMELEGQLKPESGKDLVELLTRIAPKFVFLRGYIPKSYSEKTESSARNTVKQHEDMLEKGGKIDAKIKEMQVNLAEMKPPALFGKKKYLEDQETLKVEISQKQEELQAMRLNMQQNEATYNSARQTLNEIECELDEHNKKYELDEAYFNKKKGELIATIADAIIALPSGFRDFEWEAIIPWAKAFFRAEPTKTILPVIGWDSPQVFLIASKFCSSDWEDSTESIFIEGKPKKVTELILDFLFRFIEHARIPEDPYSHLLHASIRSAVLVYVPDVVKTAAFLDNMKGIWAKETWVAAANTSIKNSPLGTNLKNIYELIDKGKQLALASNNEEAYSSLSSFEKKCDEGPFGQFKRFL